jgi:uncharacterized membrane protein YbhN (UPF0104 family)
VTAAPADGGGAVRWTRGAAGLAVGVIVAGVAMALLGVSAHEVVDALRGARWAPLAFAAAGSLVLLALQSLRWWLVMRPVVRLPYRFAYAGMAVGFLCNVILPARGGDLLRVLYLGRRTGVSRAKLLGTEIVDLTSDKWGWIAAFGIMCLLGTPPPWLFHALGILFAALAFGSLLLVLMGSSLWRRRGGATGPAWLANLRDGFAAQEWKRLLLLETLVAPLPWLWETLLIVVAAGSLDIPLSPIQAFATLTAFNLASVVPSPGNVGAFEAGGALALAHFGVARPAALAFMVLYHLTQIVPGAVAGGVILGGLRDLGGLGARDGADAEAPDGREREEVGVSVLAFSMEEE